MELPKLIAKVLLVIIALYLLFVVAKTWGKTRDELDILASTQNITLVWNPNTNPAVYGFRLRVATNSNFNPLAFPEQVIPSTQNQTPLVGLAPNTLYYFRLTRFSRTCWPAPNAGCADFDSPPAQIQYTTQAASPTPAPTASPIPKITVVPSIIYFYKSLQGPNPPDQSLKIKTSTGNNWFTQDTCQYFNINPTTGTSLSQQAILRYNPNALGPGTYQCPITVSSPGLPNKIVQTTFVVTP